MGWERGLGKGDEKKGVSGKGMKKEGDEMGLEMG